MFDIAGQPVLDKRSLVGGCVRLNLGTSGERLELLVRALPRSYTGRGLNLPGPQLAAISGTGLGFYSFLYRYMYEGEGPAHLAAMEAMRQKLPALMRAAGETISDAAASYLADAPALNSSEHGPYREYYGAALRDLVGERDGELIALHGYGFGA